MKILKTILFSLFGLLFVNGGLDKFLHYMPMPKEGLSEELVRDNNAIGEIAWLMPLVGFAELLGGLFILIPKTRALGVLVIFPLMVGILLTHIFVAPDGLIMAMVLWAVLLWMIVDNKNKYLPLIQ